MNSGLVHPDTVDLLLYRDGELSNADVRSHLESCGECRQWLERLDDVESLYEVYDQAVLRAQMVQPPRPWALDLDRRSEKPRAVRWTWWAVAACLAVLGIMYRTWREPVVSAGDLLQKAAVVEEARGGDLVVTTGGRRVVRPAGDCCANDPVRVLFVSAHYSWTNPLSARSFAAWRDGLANKSDRVAVSAAAYEVSTSTPDGVLEQASLTLDRQRLRASRGVWRFRGAETVEISEAGAGQSAGGSTVPAPPNDGGIREAAPVLPERHAEVEGPSEELHAMVALHDLGADLGEPVEVGSAGGEALVVTVIGATTEREAQIRSALAGIPGVVVRTRASGGRSMADSRPSVPPVTATSGMTPFQMKLLAKLGGTDAVDRFTNDALELSDSITARAHALNDLARRFPAGVESGLTVSDEGVLRRLRVAHGAEVSASASKLAGMLEPYVGSVSRGALPPASWQQLAGVLLARARTFDTALSQTLAGSDQDPAAEQRLNSALAALAAASSSLDR